MTLCTLDTMALSPLRLNFFLPLKIEATTARTTRMEARANSILRRHCGGSLFDPREKHPERKATRIPRSFPCDMGETKRALVVRGNSRLSFYIRAIGLTNRWSRPRAGVLSSFT